VFLMFIGAAVLVQAVEPAAPVVTFGYPLANDHVKGTFTAQFTATDDSPIVMQG